MIVRCRLRNRKRIADKWTALQESLGGAVLDTPRRCAEGQSRSERNGKEIGPWRIATTRDQLGDRIFQFFQIIRRPILIRPLFRRTQGHDAADEVGIGIRGTALKQGPPAIAPPGGSYYKIGSGSTLSGGDFGPEAGEVDDW